MRFRVCDLETTGLEATAHVVEIASIDVIDGKVSVDSSQSSLVRPPCPIPYTASAIHHITDADVATAKSWGAVAPLFLDVDGVDGVTAFAAHSAEFEKKWLSQLIPLPWICTFKCALRAWPTLQSHSNHGIRYARQYPVNIARAMPPHRALPDAYVTAHILIDLLQTYTVEQLIAWSAEPALMPTCPIGEHRGKPWPDVDKGFLDWICSKKGMDDDIVWNARRELLRRDDAAVSALAAKQNAYTEAALEIVLGAVTVEDLRCWFAWEADARSELKIYPDTGYYKRIVEACTRKASELPPAIQKPEEA